MTRPRILLLACACSLVALPAACSDDDGQVVGDTTTSVVAPETSSATTVAPGTTGDTTAETSTSSSVPVPQDAISVAVYWTRPYGTARPIDIPGYQDPPDGPFPYVLYGSVTNTGDTAISSPVIGVEWILDGTTVHTGTGELYDPQGAVLASLAPGASADLIVVVDDEAAAADLADAVPTFGVREP